MPSPESDYDDKKKVGRWTEHEDLKLQKLIDEYGEKSWRIISDMMEGRSAIQCLHRWTKILKPGLRKGPWQEEEDEMLLQWVKSNGPCKWSICAENITGRSGKQCRERWFNNLNPNVKKGGWTSEEDKEIFRGYLQHSSSWSKIAKNLSGRTENSVKNRFYSTVRKLLADEEKNGISIKLLENDTTNGTNALQSFVRQQLAKYQNQAPEAQEVYQQIGEEASDQQVMKQEESASQSESKSRKKQLAETYQEQNLLYRLLQSQGGPIKRTSCMKDYSTIYKKYKKRYNQKKKDKKLSDKVENLRKLILKKSDDQVQLNLESQFAHFEAAKLEASQFGDADKMSEFQNKLLAFFNQQLNDVMKKFYQEVGDDTKKSQKWQMVLTEQLKPQDLQSKQKNQQQQTQQQQQPPQPQKRSKRQQQKIQAKEEEEVDQNAQVMSNFLQKFNHLGQLGVTQLGSTINDASQNQIPEGQIIQDQKIDQKMMFLISQLHTLENMLGDTKKEFSRLEQSLYEKINNNNSLNSNHSSNN